MEYRVIYASAAKPDEVKSGKLITFDKAKGEAIFEVKGFAKRLKLEDVEDVEEVSESEAAK